jgi:hypothetical protein
VIRISTRFVNDYQDALKKMGEGDFTEMTRVTQVFARWVLGWAIWVYGSGSCQPGRPNYINGSDTNSTQLLIGL